VRARLRPLWAESLDALRIRNQKKGNRAPVPSRRMQTRYLIVAALVTALVILGASLVWLLRVAT
jgi:hypothetical protein